MKVFYDISSVLWMNKMVPLPPVLHKCKRVNFLCRFSTHNLRQAPIVYRLIDLSLVGYFFIQRFLLISYIIYSR